MDAETYNVIYSASDHPFYGLLGAAYYLLFAIGFVVFGFTEPGAKRWLAFLGAACVVGVTYLDTSESWTAHVAHRSRLLGGDFANVEGIASVPYGDLVMVGNRRFNRDGNTAAFPRPIDLDGRCVRVLFYESQTGQDRILWTGIRNDGCATQPYVETTIDPPP